MTEIQYLQNRVGILESVLSQLIGGELKTLAPYAGERWHLLDSLHRQALDENRANDAHYTATKETK